MASKALASESLVCCLSYKPNQSFLSKDQRQDKFELQPSGRMQLILGSLGPLILVIPDENRTQELSVALRIAHDLHKFHRIDSEVVLSSEALESVLGSAMGEGNLVIIGNVDDASLARWCFSRQESVFKINSNPPTLNGQMLDEDSGESNHLPCSQSLKICRYHVLTSTPPKSARQYSLYHGRPVRNRKSRSTISNKNRRFGPRLDSHLLEG